MSAYSGQGAQPTSVAAGAVNGVAVSGTFTTLPFTVDTKG